MCILILYDVVNKYSNTFHRAIKMKPAHVKPSIYIDSSKEIHDEDLKFKISDIVTIRKYINVPNWFEEMFLIKKVKNAVPWMYVISYVKGEETVRRFYEKELKKTNQREFRVEKVIKRKVKWKGYDICFNSWIDKKDIV